MSLRRGIDPLVMLATGMHAQPGVYAVLLGSGISTAAGIPTGWGVVQDLVRQAAAAQDPGDADGPDRAAADPDTWWAEHGEGEPLGYSNLLASLAPTGAARRGLLARFFEPTEDDVTQGRKVPTPGHRALAQLVKKGLVRVIMTTNFDRLTERALEDAGVPPQVISRPETIPGMTPLAHSNATVIKLHGDYSDLGMRNTVEELSEYPPEWDALLDRVLDDYGLLICGWSAEWDVALVAAINRGRTRRYPLYWDERSSKGETAQQLLRNRSGIAVPALSADELFNDLRDRTQALTTLTEPPLTTAMAVERVKRYLLDATRAIDLHDVVTGFIADAAEAAAESPVLIEDYGVHALEDLFERLLDVATPSLHLLVTGSYHDHAGSHTRLWVESLQRLMRSRSTVSGPFQDPPEQARHYPALLALRAMGIASLHGGNDGLLIHLATRAVWRDPATSRARIPAAQALHQDRVLDRNVVGALPRWNGKWHYPLSRLLREDLRDIFRPVIPDDADYTWISHQYEYRVALLQHQTQDVPGAFGAASGEFIGEGQWTTDGLPLPEVEFRTAASTAADDWPWWEVVGGQDKFDAILNSLRADLSRLRAMD